MIAMQYNFTLPADYDMSVIDRRIADKGPLLDGFPGFKFKSRRMTGLLRTADSRSRRQATQNWDRPCATLAGGAFAPGCREPSWRGLIDSWCKRRRVRRSR
jgi:Domain of unknown function (DUF4865)